MNQRFPELPPLTGATVAYRRPWLLDMLFRVALGGTGVGLGVLLFRHWSGMESEQILIVAPFVVVLTLVAFMKNRTQFVADERGIFFPCNAMCTRIRPASSGEWLFVPWNRVSNIRLERSPVGRRSAKCVAFDPEVSPDEVRDFFKYVTYAGPPDPTDTRRVEALRSMVGFLRRANVPIAGPTVFTVLYTDKPPYPGGIVRKLRKLKEDPREST